MNVSFSSSSEYATPPGPFLPHTDGCFPGRDIRSPSLQKFNDSSLPIWTMDHAIYSVVLHLADSIPVHERMKWAALREELKTLVKKERRDYTDEEIELLKTAYGERIEKYLAAGNGSCLLRDMRAANAVADVFEHDNGDICAIHAWTIMPNHVHLILQLKTGTELRPLLQKWKRISGHAVNRALAREGEVWMDDIYTRIISTPGEYGRQMSYLWNNPDAAGLKDGFLRRRYVP